MPVDVIIEDDRWTGLALETLAHWKKKYGVMGKDQLKCLKHLQKENVRLRRAVSDLTRDKLILAEGAKANFQVPLVVVPAMIMSAMN